MLSPKMQRCARLTKPFLPYLRWNDHEDMAKAVEQYKSGNRAAFEKLLTDLQQNIEVVAQCKTSANEDEQLLYTEIAPWLLKLQTMVAAATTICANSKSRMMWHKVGRPSCKPQKPTASLETDKRFDAAALEGLGSGVNVSAPTSQLLAQILLPLLGRVAKYGFGSATFRREGTFCGAN